MRAGCSAPILWSTLTLALGLLVGCSDDAPETAVIARLDAEGSLRGRIEQVAIRVTGERDDGGDPTMGFDESFRTDRGAWPLVTVIAPKDGEAGRVFTYEATGLDADGVALGRVRVRAAFVQSERVQVDLIFTEACSSIMCEPDESCEEVDGMSQCVDAERMLMPDSPDGGPGDMAVPDLGDLGSPDSPPDTVELLWPPNGHYTGSPSGSDPAALRPTLRWLPAARATFYEVELLDCEGTTAIATCPFPAEGEVDNTGSALPEWTPVLDVPQTEAPVGARFRWRVAGCNDAGCGPFSESRYLNVGRLPSDFDGDGFGDVAVGDHRARVDERANAGAVSVYAGEASLGTADGMLLPSPSPTAEGIFGFALAACDVNGDGYGDLAVGAPRPSAPGGRVYVYRGSSAGLVAGDPFDLRGDPEDFGRSVACLGDIDGDGFDDLAVGSNAIEDVAILHGAADGPQAPLMVATGLAPMADIEEARPFAVGDVDGDGFVDLVVGVPLLGAFQNGRVLLLRSRPSGSLVSSVPVPIDHPNGGTTEARNSRFGARATGGDFDGDGFSDVAISAPDWDGGTGRVYVRRGGRDGGASNGWEPFTGSGMGRFGQALAAGDLDGDGADDLLVGEPFFDNVDEPGGRVAVYPGASASPTIIPNPSEADAEFGRAVAVVDMDGDDGPELVVGAPASNLALRFLDAGDRSPQPLEAATATAAPAVAVEHGGAVAP